MGEPRSLSFIAAIDCAALAAVQLDITLPHAGTLLFSYFDGQYGNHETTVGFWEPATLARRTASSLSGSARRFANSVASPARSAGAASGNSGRPASRQRQQHWVSIAAATGQRAIDARVAEVLITGRSAC